MEEMEMKWNGKWRPCITWLPRSSLIKGPLKTVCRNYILELIRGLYKGRFVQTSFVEKFGRPLFQSTVPHPHTDREPGTG